MAERKMVELRQLEVGYEFSPARYQLQPSMVNAYLEAAKYAGLKRVLTGD